MERPKFADYELEAGLSPDTAAELLNYIRGLETVIEARGEAHQWIFADKVCEAFNRVLAIDHDAARDLALTPVACDPKVNDALGAVNEVLPDGRNGICLMGFLSGAIGGDRWLITGQIVEKVAEEGKAEKITKVGKFRATQNAKY